MIAAWVYHPEPAAGRPDFSFFTLTHVYLKLDQKSQQASDQVHLLSLTILRNMCYGTSCSICTGLCSHGPAFALFGQAIHLPSKSSALRRDCLCSIELMRRLGHLLREAKLDNVMSLPSQCVNM